MRAIMREERVKKGWSQEELGRIVGVSTAAISAIENEARKPSLEVAFRIAKALGKTVDELFGDAFLQSS